MPLATSKIVFMIHNLTKSIVCSAASGAFVQIKTTMSHYFQLVFGESEFWGCLERLRYTSRLYFRQIIYAFVLMSSNLHRLSPSKPQSTLLNSVCQCSHYVARLQRDLWQRGTRGREIARAQGSGAQRAQRPGFACWETPCVPDHPEITVWPRLR